MQAEKFHNSTISISDCQELQYSEQLYATIQYVLQMPLWLSTALILPKITPYLTQRGITLKISALPSMTVVKIFDPF